MSSEHLPEKFNVLWFIIGIFRLHKDAHKVFLADHQQLHIGGGLHRSCTESVEQQTDLLRKLTNVHVLELYC